MKNPGQKNQHPPKLATQLFFWFSGTAVVEDLYGDMEEIYLSNVEAFGKKKANRLFWRQVISLTFSYAIEKRKRDSSYSYQASPPSLAMLNNYFKVATRNLLKHKLFTGINLVGLAMGMSICLLAITMIHSVSNFDKFHLYGDRIFRINTNWTSDDGKADFATSAVFVADQLDQYPSLLEHTTRINVAYNSTAVHNKNQIPLEAYYADDNFLSTFSLPLIHGDSTTALTDPFSIVITEKAAKKIFGNTAVLGQLLEIENTGRFKITGVMKNYPNQSHAQFEALFSYKTLSSLNRDLIERREDILIFTSSYNYVLLKPGINPSDLNETFSQIASKMNTVDEKFNFYLEPVEDIMSSSANLQMGPSFEKFQQIFFLTLTLLILLPACFNYANLSMARSLRRSKEIGLRKVVGGKRRDIFIQFVFEAIILALISLVGAIFLFMQIREEYLSLIIDSHLFDLSITPYILTIFVGFAIGTGLIAGIIPALYFSKIQARHSLTGGLKLKSFAKFNLRKALTVAQFGLSLLFIFGVFAMGGQYKHTLNFEFGFDEENKMIVPAKGVDIGLLKNELASFSQVQTVGLSSGVPGTFDFERTWVQLEPTLDSLQVYQLFVDNMFLEQMSFNMLQGSLFDEKLNLQKEEQLIVNQALIKAMNWDNESVLHRQIDLGENKKGRIVGIVEDFNHQPLREKIKPFFFRYNPDHFKILCLEVNSTNLFGTLVEFENAWAKVDGPGEFEFSFLEENLKDVYVMFIHSLKAFSILSLLAITIACLGMLGMVVFTCENRIKEIGIRKVMGANIRSLTILLSSGFLKMILISCVVALPLSYLLFDFLFSELLSTPKPIGALEIVGSTLILVILGALCVLSQTIKTARLNPVDNLRHE